MVHQCLSEDGWFGKMLGIDVDWPPLPATETRGDFLVHYGEASGRRLDRLRRQPGSWFEEIRRPSSTCPARGPGFSSGGSPIRRTTGAS